MRYEHSTCTEEKQRLRMETLLNASPLRTRQTLRMEKTSDKIPPQSNLTPAKRNQYRERAPASRRLSTFHHRRHRRRGRGESKVWQRKPKVFGERNVRGWREDS